MDENESKPAEGVDFTVLADHVDVMREAIRAMVAGMVADGFTDREAHALVAGFWASHIKEIPEDQS